MKALACYVVVASVWATAALAQEATPSGESMNIASQAPTGARAYQRNFLNFNYFIEQVGVVTIEKVTLGDGVLTALYSYVEAGEHRSVRSVLKRGTDGLYRGKCSTNVKGRHRFSVQTSLRFSDDGTASGNWAWTGEPNRTDPAVTITKRASR